MLRQLKKQTGSGIVWAMAVAGFLLLIVTAVLSISFSYHRRSQKNDQVRQAYLTARSGVDLVVEEFVAGSSTAEEILAFLRDQGQWQVEDVGFSAEMGRCSLLVSLDTQSVEGSAQVVTVTATAVAGSAVRSITATLIGVIDRKPPGSMDGETVESDTQRPAGRRLIWYLSSYTDGEKGETS